MTRAQQTRKVLLDIARRRQRAGTGSDARFLRQRTSLMQWPALDRILHDVPFAVIGAVAARFYMPERMTRDVDIVVPTTQLEAAAARLRAAAWREVGKLTIGGQSWQSPDGVPLDVVAGHEAWWPEAIAQAQANRDAQGLPILPLPYLVLMKFRAARTVDLGDIARMLALADESQRDAVRTLFRRHEPDGGEDLESLIELGKLEMQEE